MQNLTSALLFLPCWPKQSDYVQTSFLCIDKDGHLNSFKFIICLDFEKTIDRQRSNSVKLVFIIITSVCEKKKTT